MNLKIITTLTDTNAPGWHKLEESLIRNGWDYQAIIHNWTGYGSKIIQTYNYLKNNPQIDYFIYLDAYDTYALGTPDEFKKRLQDQYIVISSEKNCWPDRNIVGMFDKVNHFWKYPNSGQIYGKREAYIEVVESNMPNESDDDQRYWTKRHLENKKIKQDYCDLFQSIAFEIEGDFEYNFCRLYNRFTHSFPIFIHGNGKTDMTKIYELCKA